MTDQGRGYGSEPWGQAGPYPGQGGYPPQQPYPYGQQQPPQQQGYPQGGYPQGGYPQQPQHPQQPGGYPQDPYGTGQQPVYQPQQPYPGQPQQPQQPQHPGYPQDPYGTGQQPVYQPPQPGYPQQHAPQPQRPAQPPQTGPGPDGIDWVAEAAKMEAEARGETLEEAPPRDSGRGRSDEDVFVERDEDGEEYVPFLSEEDDSRSGRRKESVKGRSERKRSGFTCLTLLVVMAVVLAGGGYFGYKFYESHWGAPADYTGAGTTDVNVVVPLGADGWKIGNTLKAAGVVETAGAFVAAYDNNKNSTNIQPGSYTLKLHMSAVLALQALISQQGGDHMTVFEGETAKQIYAQIDKKLSLPAGTTAAAEKAGVADLGLPAEAKGNPEGFLWPTRYSVSKDTKPLDLLKQMVQNTLEKIQVLNLATAGQGVKLNDAYAVLTEASILQAEGNNKADFGKIARVLYNRLNTNDTYGLLGLDTTLQYYLGRTHFTYAEKNSITSGYNTYKSKGLPPSPISNPGEDAINAVLNPTPGPWAYFIAMDSQNTRFSVTFDDFKKDVKEYCTAHHMGFDSQAGACV